MELGNVIVLTTKSSLNRNEYIKNLENLGKYNFFYGYDKKIDLLNFLEQKNKKFLYHPFSKSGILYKGQIGCYIGHYLILKKIVDESLENTIVLENDIIIEKKKNWKSYLNQALLELPIDYDILLLYSRSRNLENETYHIENKKFITEYNKTSGAVAYMISLEGAKRLMNMLDNTFLKPYDLFFKELAKENKVFNLKSNLFKVNLSFDSTIKTGIIINDINNYSNYEFYKHIILDEDFEKKVLIIRPHILSAKDNILLRNIELMFQKNNFSCRNISINKYAYKKIKKMELIVLFSSLIWPHRKKKIFLKIKERTNSKIVILNTELFSKNFYNRSFDKMITNSDFIIETLKENVKKYKNMKIFKYVKINTLLYENLEFYENTINSIIQIRNKKSKLKDLDIDIINLNNIKVINENLDQENLNIYLENTRIVIYDLNNSNNFYILEYLIANNFYVLLNDNIDNYNFLEKYNENNLQEKINIYNSMNDDEIKSKLEKNKKSLENYINDYKLNLDILNKFYVNDKNKDKKIDYLLMELNDFKNDLLVDLDNIPYNLKLKNKNIIVGSSGKMKEINLGGIIDTYENIIRINFAPIINYENFVGSKTTIRVIRNNALRKVNGELENFLNDADITIFIGESRLEKIRKKLDKNKIHLKLNSKYGDFFSKFFNKSLSTGLYTVLICNLYSESKLDLTGFMNLGNINGKHMYHYWEHLNGRQKSFIGKNTNHHFLDESKVIKKLTNILF